MTPPNVETPVVHAESASKPRHSGQNFTVRGTLTPRTDLLVGLLGIAILIIVWSFITYGKFVSPIFLPKPIGIWQGLMDFQQHGWLFPAIMRSVVRVTKALLLVVLIGVPIGVLMGAIPTADALLRKLINGAKSVPTTGILGLVVLWLGLEEQGKVVFLFLGSIFYMIILVNNAVQAVNEDYLKVALDIGANRWQIITRVLIPGALPQIWEAIAVCNGIMWTYIVLAEYINSNENNLGLGYLLNTGGRHNESGQVFGTLIIIALISSLTDWILRSVKKRFFYW